MLSLCTVATAGQSSVSCHALKKVFQTSILSDGVTVGCCGNLADGKVDTSSCAASASDVTELTKKVTKLELQNALHPYPHAWQTYGWFVGRRYNIGFQSAFMGGMMSFSFTNNAMYASPWTSGFLNRHWIYGLTTHDYVSETRAAAAGAKDVVNMIYKSDFDAIPELANGDAAAFAYLASLSFKRNTFAAGTRTGAVELSTSLLQSLENRGESSPWLTYRSSQNSASFTDYNATAITTGDLTSITYNIDNADHLIQVGDVVALQTNDNQGAPDSAIGVYRFSLEPNVVNGNMYSAASMDDANGSPLFSAADFGGVDPNVFNRYHSVTAATTASVTFTVNTTGVIEDGTTSTFQLTTAPKKLAIGRPWQVSDASSPAYIQPIQFNYDEHTMFAVVDESSGTATLVEFQRVSTSMGALDDSRNNMYCNMLGGALLGSVKFECDTAATLRGTSKMVSSNAVSDLLPATFDGYGRGTHFAIENVSVVASSDRVIVYTSANPYAPIGETVRIEGVSGMESQMTVLNASATDGSSFKTVLQASSAFGATTTTTGGTLMTNAPLIKLIRRTTSFQTTVDVVTSNTGGFKLTPPGYEAAMPAKLSDFV